MGGDISRKRTPLMDPLVIFMMSTKGHKSSLKMIIHHFAVFKTCFLNFIMI